MLRTLDCGLALQCCPVVEAVRFGCQSGTPTVWQLIGNAVAIDSNNRIVVVGTFDQDGAGDALPDVKNLKWKELVTLGIPIPTPWAKVPYDSIEAIRGKLDDPDRRT